MGSFKAFLDFSSESDLAVKVTCLLGALTVSSESVILCSALRALPPDLCMSVLIAVLLSACLRKSASLSSLIEVDLWLTSLILVLCLVLVLCLFVCLSVCLFVALSCFICST